MPTPVAAVTMVEGLGGATPAVEVGDLLGWNTSGYWAVTTTVAEAVLRVTHVDNDAQYLRRRTTASREEVNHVCRFQKTD